jgi:hypothetical protein
MRIVRLVWKRIAAVPPRRMEEAADYSGGLRRVPDEIDSGPFRRFATSSICDAIARFAPPVRSLPSARAALCIRPSEALAPPLGNRGSAAAAIATTVTTGFSPGTEGDPAGKRSWAT